MIDAMRRTMAKLELYSIYITTQAKARRKQLCRELENPNY